MFVNLICAHPPATELKRYFSWRYTGFVPAGWQPLLPQLWPRWMCEIEHICQRLPTRPWNKALEDKFDNRSWNTDADLWKILGTNWTFKWQDLKPFVFEPFRYNEVIFIFVRAVLYLLGNKWQKEHHSFVAVCQRSTPWLNKAYIISKASVSAWTFKGNKTWRVWAIKLPGIKILQHTLKRCCVEYVARV